MTELDNIQNKLVDLYVKIASWDVGTIPIKFVEELAALYKEAAAIRNNTETNKYIYKEKE